MPVMESLQHDLPGAVAAGLSGVAATLKKILGILVPLPFARENEGNLGI
jgi:hypothetical protein